MIHTWFFKSYTHRLSTPGDKRLIQRINIFCTGNGHVHAFDTPTKIAQIGWGHHIHFRVWIKSAISFVEGCTYMCVFFIFFYALAQASDFRIERREVVFLCWILQDSNPGSLEPTECPLKNRLSYRGSSQKLISPPLWSASIQPTRPHCRLAFAPGSGDIYVSCC